VVDSHRGWLQSLDVEVVADQAFRQITPEAFKTILSDADGVIVPASQPIAPGLMQLSRRLRVISFAASGYDSVDVSAATQEGIVVTNAPVPELAEVVADLTWGLMLSVARQIPQHDRQVRAGSLHRGMGISPWRKTLGIVGLGRIGKAVARRACGFEMKLLTTDRSSDTDFIAQHSITQVPLEDLLRSSDFVSLHLRLNDTTRSIIGQPELALMRPMAFLLNTARRELVDENALAEALANGQVAGAGLDDAPSDPRSPLMAMDNVVFTTHIGNRARTGVDAVFRRAILNAADVLAGRPCGCVVNPLVNEVYLRERTQAVRKFRNDHENHRH
jgi:D-3-phosphoglycerate dehydrogenase